MPTPPLIQPVLILGGGINGAAVARDLLLNNVPVCLVDAHDIASGATSRSSRLIHGGLRYLEYGDFALVRESLVERERLLRLAPQFVQPLRLFIPVRRRFGGLTRAGLKFLGLDRVAWINRLLARFGNTSGDRSLCVTRLGLWLYDLCARSRLLPSSAAQAIGATDVPHVDSHGFRWLCSYSDAQMLHPERFVVALLDDARQIAVSNGTVFRVLNYHRVRLESGRARIVSVDDGTVRHEFEPTLIINATGAAGDRTLEQLPAASPRLFAGTKGSHFVTFHEGLRNAIGPHGVYAEAADGRLIFVLPFGAGVLVGTTDEYFEGDPDQAVATDVELDYLVQLVNGVFPSVGLTRRDITLHYAGVRPLPQTNSTTPAAVTRRHAIVRSTAGSLPVLTLIGGKLTTCRAFAEEVADRVLAELKLPRAASTRDRPIPDREPFPADDSQPDCLHATSIPLSYVRRVIDREWVVRLEDLVERRLMLIFQPRLSSCTLRQLAECLIAARGSAISESESSVSQLVEEYRTRLRNIYGRIVRDDG
ncbi:MAG: glycerol-3-phosphate dehydrogenase/oxidase [Planctomycetales bacterium]|nr:glycerol-3-phosphate dehydrogenase/oxidase [Planctomycetales bacterium]